MNIAKMMQQAQRLQADMQATQEQLANKTVEASVGGGKVNVTATGTGEVVAIKIDRAVVDPEDVEFLEELVLKGVQDAIAKGKEMAAEEMKKVTGGMNIPGI